MIKFALVTFLIGIILPIITHADNPDHYQWLEPSNDPRALQWVDARNKKTLPVLQTDARFAGIQAEAKRVILASDRLPHPGILGNFVMDFWQDDIHAKGILRQTTLSNYQTGNPNWETVIDVDQLAKDERTDWVWEGAVCLPPDYRRCLVKLSIGGKDAVLVREFDFQTRKFVTDGFNVPEAKTDIAWKDENTVLIGTDTGADSMTHSGYPRTVSLWKRGTPLADAKLLYTGKATDVEISGTTQFRPEGPVTTVNRATTFFASESFVLSDADGKLTKIPKPDDAILQGFFRGFTLIQLRTDWTPKGKTFTAGSLISLPTAKIAASDFADALELVYEPDDRSAFSSLSTSSAYFTVNVLNNVKSQLLEFRRSDRGDWTSTAVALPENGTITTLSADDESDYQLHTYEDFLTPPTQYLSAGGELPKAIKNLPSRFDAGNLVVEQFAATSADGTKVPYFIVHAKNMPLDGNNPTLLNAYGGFEIAETPFYVGQMGNIWLNKGGVYVLGNIRGGGEFGPKWHQAALTVNRQRAYDDFAAIAQDLQTRKVTSPRRLAIKGGSNGGLLMGVEFTEHPELYRAVICEVALLDMIRYTQLGAGASWIAEYGDPAIPEMAAAILKYSPYQKVNATTRYPNVFFVTSTTDDRVTPAHARKMAAKMDDMGHPILFWENTDGGHGAAATLADQVMRTSLEYTYLFQQIVD